MAIRVRAVEYFNVTVKDRPGEAYRLLSQLATAGVNLLAFSAVPSGPEVTQLVLFPDSTEGLTAVAERAGLVLTGPQRAILVQGDDRLGALAEIHGKLFEAQVDVYASTGITDGKGDYGCVLYVKPGHFKSATHALGVDASGSTVRETRRSA
jgi:hypothetical protein